MVEPLRLVTAADMKRLLALTVGLVLLFVCSPNAHAHAAPHSIVLLDVHSHDVGTELRLPIPEIASALDRPFSQTALTEDDRRIVHDYVRQNLHAVSPDDSPWIIDVGKIETTADDVGGNIVVHATLTPPRAHSSEAFDLTDDVIGNEVNNHIAWVGVRSDFANGFISGDPAFVGATHFLHHTVHVDRSGGGASRGFRSIFALGMQHIAEGTDHLLFLLALLLPAPLLLARGKNRARWGKHSDVRTSLGKLLRVVTAFTIGHSLTLLIGTLGWVRLPSTPVETLIAFSILVSAVHAMRPFFSGREAWVACGFGLVHGLAFAGALSELHLDAPRLALALFGFNLGIEAMQLIVIAAIFPWFLLLARTRFYSSFRIFGSAFAAVAAIGWIAERAFHFSNPVDAVVTSVAHHPLALLASLACVTLLAIRTTSSATPRTCDPVAGSRAPETRRSAQLGTASS